MIFLIHNIIITLLLLGIYLLKITSILNVIYL